MEKTNKKTKKIQLNVETTKRVNTKKRGVCPLPALQLLAAPSPPPFPPTLSRHGALLFSFSLFSVSLE